MQIGQRVPYSHVQSVKDEFRLLANVYLVQHHNITLSEVRSFIAESNKQEVLSEYRQAYETEYERWIHISEQHKG